MPCTTTSGTTSSNITFKLAKPKLRPADSLYHLSTGGFTEQEFRAKMEELAKSQGATLEPRWRADPVAALSEIMFGEAMDQMRERHDYSPAFER
jgi:hypothetical protein